MILIVLAICLQHAASQTIVTVAVGSVANLTFPYIIQPDQLSCFRGSSSITFTGRYGKVVDNSTGLVNVTISSVQREDYGPYMCQTPTVGQFMTYSIVVADNLTLTVSPQTLLQVKDLVNITCKATFSIQSNLVLTGDQLLALYLYVGTTNIQKDDAELITQVQSLRSRNLTYVGNVTEEMKRNNITCRLSSINPQFSTNVSVMANVAYAPLNVTIANDTGSSNNVYNANEMLLCYAKGNPPPIVVWLLVSSINNCVTSETITGSGSAILNLSPNCLGYQTWNCTSTYQLNQFAPANVTFKTFSFTLNQNNASTGANTGNVQDSKALAIGLGVGLGLGIPLLLLLLGLIYYCCVKRRTQKSVPVKKAPPATTKQQAPVPANPKPNPAYQAPPTYNQVKPNGTAVVSGTPGVPDIGVAHLDGSGSIPQLNTSADGIRYNFKADQGRDINLGRADLGYQNHSYTNI